MDGTASCETLFEIMAEHDSTDEGFDAILAEAQKEWPEFELYSMSTDWFDQIDAGYGLKFKGARGDRVLEIR